MSRSLTTSLLSTRTTLRSALSVDAARLLRAAAAELSAEEDFAADPAGSAEAYVAVTFPDLPEDRQAILVALLLDEIERELAGWPDDRLAFTRTHAAELDCLRAVALIADIQEKAAEAAAAIVANLR